MILARLAATGGAAFSPADLSPKAWFDASDTSTITESGGAVSQWDNLGSLGNLTQGNATYQPTTGSSTLNGLNVIDFGTSDHVENTTKADWKFLHDGSTYIVAAVWKPKTTGGRHTLFDTGGSYWGVVGAQIALYDLADPNDIYFHRVTKGGANSSDLVVLNRSSQNYVAINTWFVSSLLADPDDATLADRSFLQGNELTLFNNNASSGTVSAANPQGNFRLAATYNLGDDDPCAIAELIIVDGANATDENRIALRNYLNNKWAVY